MYVCVCTLSLAFLTRVQSIVRSHSTQPTAVRDWNAEFQALLTSSGPDKYRLLANLSHDFVNIARTCACLHAYTHSQHSTHTLHRLCSPFARR